MIGGEFPQLIPDERAAICGSGPSLVVPARGNE